MISKNLPETTEETIDSGGSFHDLAEPIGYHLGKRGSANPSCCEDISGKRILASAPVLR